MSGTSEADVKDGGIDLRGLGYSALWLSPLFLWPLLFDLLGWLSIEQLIVSASDSLARGLTQAFGITAVIVSVGVLSQSRRGEFSLKSYWRAILVFAGLLILPYVAFFLFMAVRLGPDMLAPFQRRSNIFLSALLLAAPLVTMFATAWLYLRLRRAIADEAERRRFLFLVGAGLVLSLPNFIHHSWQGVLAFTSDASHEPGYVYSNFVSWLSTLIGALFIGFGLAFLFGLPAIFWLKRASGEHSVAASLGVMLAAAMGIWLAAFGLDILGIWLALGEPPAWDYWPTQEAVIVLGLLAVGGVVAGLLYPFLLARTRAP